MPKKFSGKYEKEQYSELPPNKNAQLVAYNPVRKQKFHEISDSM